MARRSVERAINGSMSMEPTTSRHDEAGVGDCDDSATWRSPGNIQLVVVRDCCCCARSDFKEDGHGIGTSASDCMTPSVAGRRHAELLFGTSTRHAPLRSWSLQVTNGARSRLSKGIDYRSMPLRHISAWYCDTIARCGSRFRPVICLWASGGRHPLMVKLVAKRNGCFSK